MSILTEEQREKKRAYEREWRKRKYVEDPEYRKRKQATDNRWKDKTRHEVRKLKLEKGCSVCGYNKCSRALQFHHKEDNKEFTVSNMLGSWKSLESIWKEIEKCEILCGNCHAEEHCNDDC